MPPCRREALTGVPPGRCWVSWLTPLWSPNVTGPRTEGAGLRLVVLVSGGGSNLKALLAACADSAYGARVVAVGADRPGTGGLRLAAEQCVPTFVEAVADYPTREEWEAWAGMPFPADGRYAVPGALVPVEFAGGRGEYVEPNVWMRHPVRAST